VTITEFLTARLDEIERDARAVKPLRELDIWGQPHHESWSIGRNSYRGEDGAAYREGDAAAVAHFLRWTPEAALAYVAAVRQIVAMAHFTDDPDGPTAVDFWLEESRAHLTPPPVHIALTQTFFALVQMFASHPDFQETWKA
jgi:hypothetical protein